MIVMDTSKGSLILKALSADADEARLTDYLGKRAKSIPRGKIPILYRNLPVVLSRNVPEPIGATVIDQLKQLGAQVLFIPSQEETAESPLDPLNSQGAGAADPCPGPDTDVDHLGFKMLMNSLRQGEAQRSFKRNVFECLLIALFLVVAGALNFIVAAPSLLLSLYTLPTILAAFFFGRPQALGTALASMALVIAIGMTHGERFARISLAGPSEINPWVHILCWGAILLLIAFLAGTLHARQKAGARELRRSYHGLILLLKHFIDKDRDRESHAFRVSVYATRIAAQMGLAKEFIEDIRTAARLHEIGKPAVSRAVLTKVVSLNRDAQVSIVDHLPLGPGYLTTPDDALNRILPMVVEMNTNGQRLELLPHKRPSLHLGARILAVADAYDSLTLPGPDRQALPPEEAMNSILARAGSEFDAEVIRAFVSTFARGEMDLPSAVV